MFTTQRLITAGGLYIMVNVLCLRLRRRFPACPASSGAGCGCGRKTWLPSSLAGCSPAEGRVPDNVHSPPSQALAAPKGFYSDESPRRRAPPRTRDASARHAYLQESGGRWVHVERRGLDLLQQSSGYPIWPDCISSSEYWLPVGWLEDVREVSSSAAVALVLSFSPPPRLSPLPPLLFPLLPILLKRTQPSCQTLLQDRIK